MPSRLLQLVPDGIRTLAPYHVPHLPGVRAKLDANELPYSLPEVLANELAAVLAKVPINRYPRSDCGELREAVADRLRVSGERLVFGNGSDELIQLVINAFSKPREGNAHAYVAYPTPSFIWFRLAALGAGTEPLEIPLDKSFELDLKRTRRIFDRRLPNIVFFARPNNPTGTLWPADDIAALASDYPDVLFVSDEAYAEYCGGSMVSYVDKLPNLVVMRTLSKVGLAALRVGYLYANATIVTEVEKVRPPYNVGAFNQAAAHWLLESHPELLTQTGQMIKSERERLSVALEAIPGIHVYPSQANLILIAVANPGDGRAGKLWMHLADRGILVRNFDRPGPLAGCLRITIGTAAENDMLLTELRTLRITEL